MSQSNPPQSILALDCGSLVTRAVLIDIAEGCHRFVACGQALSTWRPPHSSVVLGMARAVSEIERVTGRQMLDPQAQPIVPERLDGTGVDAVVLTGSAGTPLRLWIAGVVDDISMASARRAALSAGATILGQISAEDGIDLPDHIEEFLTRFVCSEPDAVVLVGGYDGSSSRRVIDLADVLVLAYQSLESRNKPPLLFAGNVDLRVSVEQAFGALTDVRMIDNVRPALEVENLTQIIEELHGLRVDRQLARLPGMGIATSWSRIRLLPTVQAMQQSLSFLSAHYGVSVLGVDLGARQASLAWARDGSADQISLSGWGGREAACSLDDIGIDSVLRWMPHDCEATQVRELMENLALYPWAVAGGATEARVQAALARETLAEVMRHARARWAESGIAEASQWDLVLLCGGLFSHGMGVGEAALIALDVIQPTGITILALDEAGLCPALGAVAGLAPSASAQVMEKDGFASLGTVVAPLGSVRKGEVALWMKAGFPHERTLVVEATSGSLEVVPLPARHKARLELKAGRHFDLGMSRRRRTAKVEVEGGAMGVIVDARGRPLPSLEANAADQAAIKEWLQQVGV